MASRIPATNKMNSLWRRWRGCIRVGLIASVVAITVLIVVELIIRA